MSQQHNKHLVRSDTGELQQAVRSAQRVLQQENRPRDSRKIRRHGAALVRTRKASYTESRCYQDGHTTAQLKRFSIGIREIAPMVFSVVLDVKDMSIGHTASAHSHANLSQSTLCKLFNRNTGVGPSGSLAHANSRGWDRGSGLQLRLQGPLRMVPVLQYTAKVGVWPTARRLII
jgi:hypothetical protein